MSPTRMPQARRPRRIAAAVFGLLLAVMLMAPPAQAIPPDGAGPDTPGTSSSTSPTSGLRPGDTLNFTVRGFPGGETLYIKIDDGLNCSQAAVHGACVYHQQRIPSSGTVSGSIVLPPDIASGQHWLRFLSSEEMRGASGSVIGTQGYTLRGQNFTVASSSSGGSSGGNSGATGSAGGSSSSGSSTSGSGSSSTSGGPGSSGGQSSSGQSSGTGQSGTDQSGTGQSSGGQSGGGSSGNTVITNPGAAPQDTQSGQGADGQAGDAENASAEGGEGVNAGESLSVEWDTSDDEADDSDTNDSTDNSAVADASVSSGGGGDQQASVVVTPIDEGFPWIGLLVMLVLLVASSFIIASAVQTRRAFQAPGEV